MDVFFLRKFVSTEDCIKLSSWIDIGIQNEWVSFGCNIETGLKNYKGRLTTRGFDDRFTFPSLVHEISNRITDSLKLSNFAKSNNGNKFGIIGTSTQTGGNVITHTDPKENNGSVHVLRCNIVTQVSESGGELVIDGKKIPLQIGDLHCYLVTLLPHSVTQVKGKTSRILWMFGYQVSIEQFNTLQESWKTLKN